MISHSNIGLCTCEALYNNNEVVDYKIINANETFLKIYKLDNEIFGKKASEIFENFNRSDFYFLDIFNENIGNLREFEFEKYFKTSNRWFKIFISFENSNNFNIILTDITDLKLQQTNKFSQNSNELLKLLNFSNNFFNEIEHLSNMGSWELNLITGELTWSVEIFNLFEIDKDKFGASYQYFLNIIHPEDREKVDKAYTDSVKNRTIYNIDHRLLFPDGRIKWVNERCQTFYDEKGNPIRSIGIVQDITERKFKEKIYETIFEATGTATLLVKEDGTIIAANKETTNVTGYEVYEMINTNILNYIHEEDKEKMLYYHKLKRKNPDLVPNKYEFKYIHKNGSVRNAIIYVGIIPDNLTSVVSIIDVTDLKLTESELIKAKEKAEESDRLKSAFLANMSHEIRTPLNGIIGFTELLLTPNLSEEKKNHYVDMVKKSGQRLINLINDLIDISKIEAGMMKVNLSQFSLYDTLDYIHDFFKPEAENKKLELKVYNILPEKDIILESDREKVYAILINLVKNAIKFTDKGSIEVGFEIKNNYLEFYVKDTGIGIPKDKQEIIFERFMQADIEDRMARQGTGLGLAITKAYVEMLGGKIWLQSQEGVCSTFYFSIPYQKKYNY
ncbi:MAG TPA: PAS domain S-box protein [Ignavibacteriales bacterium]|nr:PAS domain S-box protein [Ignavibacteriales bacterium]HOL80553.1 PAS domain S-box protein [Ignavibacteriales bacterium]HOM64242.1 PAS domain S-box protein [Ignavibacteriales bacterium]HPP33112.1 PAS domain S-box protein [Ignavibacteriales bacterium]HRR18246.1 PAS domain S-box protein [Ignavibacteriales bacterium]